MKIFIGSTTMKEKLRKESRIGRVLSDHKKHIGMKLYEGEEWIFDNGAWGHYKNGKEFDVNEFKNWLDAAYEKLPIPYFAVAPDIVAGGNKSLELSMSWIDKLPKDWPWYLAIQDNMDSANIIEALSSFKGIFLGGSSDFKKHAGYWCKIAHLHQKKFHYARCGTIAKIIHATIIQADSMDTTYPVYEKGRFYSFVQSLSQNIFDELIVFERSHRGEGNLIQVKP